MIIIGITGTLGAGKGTIVEYLVNQKGFKHFSVSGYLKEELIKQKRPIDRTSLQDIANEIRTRYGRDYITKKLFEKARGCGQDAIIESIRNPKEAEFVKSQKNGYLFAVDANPKTRYLRIKKRGSEKDKVTFREFKGQEKRELQSKNINAQNLSKCISVADFKFDNGGTIKKLYEKVEKVLAQIG